MPFSEDELQALRAESHAHRMAIHNRLEAELKRRMMRRRLLLGVTLLAVSVGLFLLSSNRLEGVISIATGG